MSDDLSQVTDKNNSPIRKSANLLPVLFRTDKNSKFLSGTIDQLIQTPQLKRVDGWVGGKITPTYNVETDFYLESNSKLRQDYQLEPALIITDDILRIIKATSYDDLINQLAFEGANTSRVDRLFKPEFYSYNPHIDWDKFVNFENYYWLPNGPDSVAIGNQQREIVSTYNVTDTADGFYFVFSPDGLTPAPQLTLYRGVTYKFNVDSKNPFWIKTSRVDGKEAPYRVTENNGIKKGTITLKIDNTAPALLYFVSENDKLNGGEFVIKSIEENSNIDVEKEILGKKDYTSSNGITFTNGLKINFIGDVTPIKYKNKHFIIEGVGDKIQLIDFDSLETPEKFTSIFDERFDTEAFDQYAFDQSNNFPETPEYVTINRSSQDKNPWSRYNRWFHEDVIKTSAEANKIPLLFPIKNKAKRPIIEFAANLQLDNFGSFAKDNVQFIDTTTTDAFTEVEGKLGYYVDGVELGQGDRIIFTADNDSYVNGKTFYVNFVKIESKFKISLEEADDVTPLDGDSITITKGTEYKGTNWWYNGNEWVLSQQKIAINQAPRFDIVNNNGISYSDETVYKGGFIGSKIFGYAIGTGTKDPVLGFPLKYKNVANQAYYLFENYFMKETNTIIDTNVSFDVKVASGFIKKNISRDTVTFLNVWSEAEEYQIPILQYNIISEETTEIQITSVDNPGYQTLDIEVYVNQDKKVLGTEYTLFASGRNYSVVFKTTLAVGDKVLFKIKTTAVPSATGYYETSPGWTNNPLNGPIEEFTLSELSDHVKTMVDRHPNFTGTFPGSSNLRDISNPSVYGTRLISNKNPLAFAGYFIANDEFNLISATRLVGQHYNQFKLALIDQITNLAGVYAPSQALDIALYNVNANKDIMFPYSMSDMIGYGTDAVTRNYTVTDSRNTVYSLLSNFDLTTLSERSVIIYHTDTIGNIKQLLHGTEYEFDTYESNVYIKIPLTKGDVIRVDDYASTRGCYVPPTPTKLGLYPKFEPKIYVDDTYVEPQTVIQGHDGSIMIAFGDSRDAVILEYERRIYNNLKIQYNPELVDLNKIFPGAFRSNLYSPKEINSILSREFLKWDAFYGFNFSQNTTAGDDPKTWNIKSGKDLVTKMPLPGGWRAVYKYFFDTDRPHTHPWEMLGFREQPEWWENEYGPAPYTLGNTILWNDLEQGLVKDPTNTNINPLYARPGLSNIIPVDDNGNLLMPTQVNIATGVDYLATDTNWEFGDQGPVETAWRRSSLWPFAVQILMALSNPASYSSLLFDTSRTKKNLAGQYTYGDNVDFHSFDVLKFYQDTVADAPLLASGYSVFLIEAGKQKNRNYLDKLKLETSFVHSKLTHKIGGFVNKDKFKIVIDSVSPSSASPGVFLADSDYSIFLDKSSPVKSIGVSGVIVQKTDKGYSIKGYDTQNPYFNCYMPMFTAVDPAVTIGGKSSPFVDWAPSASNPMSGYDTVSVSTNDGYRFYKQGQIVRHLEKFYRVKVSHNSGTTFNSANFQALVELPKIGGVTIKTPKKFEKVITLIPYGIEYSSITDVYAVLLGYERWLESEGLIFDEYSKEVQEIVDWKFSAKELIYWSTQNWAVDSVITLSPFADKLKFKNSSAVVDSLTNVFYEYSVLKADGSVLSSKNISTYREENDFTLKTLNTTDGIYFARLNLIQKEHTLVLNNYTFFNDVIYDIETGYRQRRIKLSGFITDNWNGDLFSPGFIYDEAEIESWTPFTDYANSDVVFYAGNYYTAITKIIGADTFNFNEWSVLGSKPVAELLPNFDYKIAQFDDFYSLDIDNFDQSQQSLAQHLIGYTPRPYLDNIFTNAISQYKFYQGFLKEKGTRNTIDKLSKASILSQGSYVDFYEDWAFRIGEYGSFSTDQTFEVNLNESEFKENPQIINFVQTTPVVTKDFISYVETKDVLIKPENYNNSPFSVTTKYSNIASTLPVAGYVRIDDVTATAYNKNSLLDIANNRTLRDGDTVWIGFEDNGDWGVYRYTQLPSKVINVEIYIPGTSLIVTTDSFHNLSVGDVISISQFDPYIDGVFVVDAVADLNQVIVQSLLTDLTIPFDPLVGLLFKFIRSRFNTFDDLVYLPTFDRFKNKEKVWVDNNGLDKWAVYQKNNNFDATLYGSPPDFGADHNQRYGYSIAGNADGSKLIITAPDYKSTLSPSYGRLYAYNKAGKGTDGLVYAGSRNVNPSSISTFFTGTNVPMFGQSIKFDEDSGWAVVGAPKASHVKYGSTSTYFTPVSPNSAASNKIEEGLIQFVKFDFENPTVAAIDRAVFTNPFPQSYANFGHDIAVASDTTLGKFVLISAPGQNNNAGAVYYSTFDLTTDVVSTSTLVTAEFGRISYSPALNDRFGHSISINKGQISRIAISAIGNGGYVRVSGSAAPQIISHTDYAKVGDRFGEKVLVSGDGEYLYVSAPKSLGTNGKVGKIFAFKFNQVNSLFEFTQEIENPFVDNGYDFGANMSLSPDGKTLIVSSIGSTHRPYLTFDTYSKQKSGSPKYVLDSKSTPRDSATTFDSGTVGFYSTVKNSGAVFTFTRKQEKFVFGEEIYDNRITTNQVYGKSIFVADSYIVVGAPGQDYVDDQSGALYLYESKSNGLDSWYPLREESELVDLDKIKNVKTIDTELDAVVDYLEIIDPIKGKISGLADQELRYKSLFDPAIYSIGVPGVSADTTSNWLDEHVGELWWDLGSIKYIQYEQGELEFRKNNWNSMFPGSMVDIYEWVGTPYLPSQWLAISDTNEGLAQGISGQPKFSDNSVISVKQVWDPISNSFSNFYYYWVKNKTTVPVGVQRKISAYTVATIIADPKSQGIKFASMIAENAVMLTNMQQSVIGTKINLSINLDTIDNANNKHTEWLLLQEGNKTSLPPKKLINKMLDSLVGIDSSNNIIPDETLSSRNRYGIGIRPRQTVFVNKQGALRVLVEYANSILKKNNIVDYVNLTRFLDKDTPPNSLLGQYDFLVEDLIERDFSIVTRNLKRAELACDVVNGRIVNVVIVNRGYGYNAENLKSAASNSSSENYIGPTVIVEGSGRGAVIETEINTVGQIVKTTIVNSGIGYVTSPTLTVRPFTVIVLVDTTVNNKWSKYEWNYTNKEYYRVSSQSYDTTAYWKYIDWIENEFNNAQDILATIDEPYQLSALINVPEGNYVKIRNAGDGRYIILRKIPSSQLTGTYDSQYDLVYQEAGTIQLSDALWNYSESIYGFDQIAGFDQTLFDQTPIKEINNIFLGLLEDVFVRELKVYYNLLFFKLVKYALTEQKSLDWVFKTSLVDVINYAGSLDQRPVYKLNNESYYQSYIEETKPYHTKIRNFSAHYTATDITRSVTTDFDLPSVYDTTNKQFTPITFGRPELTLYPWKAWAENYGYSVESVQVYDGGVGYDIPPVVEIVPQTGDTGSGAKAVAYIALGKVTQVIVTDPGSGYTATPLINLIGGGPSTLTPAKISVVMTNNKIRSNTIKMKFDRVAGYNEITSKIAEDKFIASGLTNEFELTWAPNPDKNFITVKLNGIRVLSGDYSISNYTEKFRGYTKKYGSLVFDTIIPKRTEITIEYRKDTSLYNAIDRIRDYYEPTSGMPGNTATLLMNGLEYPGVTVDTLPFGLSSGFDTLPFGINNWDDYIPEERAYQAKGPRVLAKFNSSNINPTTSTFYFDLINYPDVKTVKVGSTTTALTTNTIYTVTSSTYKGGSVSQWAVSLSSSTVANTTGTVVFLNPNPYTYQLDFVPELNESINVYVQTLNTVTNKFTTIRIDGTTATNPDAIMPTFVGNGYQSTITVNKIYDSTATIIFRTQSSDGSSPIVDPDLDTYISGGGYYTNLNGGLVLTKSEDYEDINIDGDAFVSVSNSYGPEENLPGRVSDSLGINIFTYPESGTGVVINRQYYREPGTFRYDIGAQPANVDAVEVLLDGIKLYRDYDYAIDFNTNEIELLTNNTGESYVDVRGPYFSSTEVGPRRENINTPIASTAGDDTFTGPYPLGFEWNMFGSVYDEVYVGTNGYLTFGSGNSSWTPLQLGFLTQPAIYIEYCDLWQALGNGGTPLATGETPGLFLSSGTVGDFTYWRLRFQGTHYNKRQQFPTVPAYQYEVTLYSNGADQYVEMIYENTWREANFNGDLGFITGIATGRSGTTNGTGVGINYSFISNDSSHVFYSTINGGNWQYAGRGSFDAFANENLIDPNIVSYDNAYVIAVTDEALNNGVDFANTIANDWTNFRNHYPNRTFALLQPQNTGGSFDDLLIPPTFNDSFKAVGPIKVNRDNGVSSAASDWFSILDLQDLPYGSVVGIAIDVSGSMSTSTVQASYDLLLQKAADAGLLIVREFWNSERWPLVWDRTLPVPSISPLTEDRTQFLSITTMGVGGKNLIDKQQFNVSSITGRNDFEIAAGKDSVKSSYVTVNGVAVSTATYTVVGSKNNTSGRAIVRFTNDLNYDDVLQIWAFAGNYKSFSEVHDQIIIANSGLNTFTLSQTPGIIGPLHSQIIVEKNGTRLSPPDTVYYIAEEGQLTFSFDYHYDYPQGLPDMAHLEIYVNGVRRYFGANLALRQEENLIEFAENTISVGDAIAIAILRDHDYIVQGQALVLTNRVDTSVASRLRVTSFTNHDSSLIRKERFPGNGGGIYRLARPALNVNYVWVEVDGKPLVNNIDYRLESDNKTVVLRSSISATTVVITSVVDKTNESLLGYRIFRDNLGRTHYKRLSSGNSTQLATDLAVTDTEITVEDASVLTPPNSAKYRPGIILVNGERIEFYKMEGNKLSSLRRGTLGTGVKTLHKESSIVVDQGAGQTIPVEQSVKTWTTATTYWATGNDNIRYGTSTWDLSTLSALTFSTSTSTQYQIDVFVQGRQLTKPGLEYIRTRTDIAYDSDSVNSYGTSSNETIVSGFSITGTNVLVLADLPREDAEIKVVIKSDMVTGFEYSNIHLRNTAQTQFLLESPSFVPDKYYYGQNTTTDQYLTLEFGDTLDSETGSPLIGL
jgi:hypothetical protein